MITQIQIFTPNPNPKMNSQLKNPVIYYLQHNPEQHQALKTKVSVKFKIRFSTCLMLLFISLHSFLKRRQASVQKKGLILRIYQINQNILRSISIKFRKQIHVKSLTPTHLQYCLYFHNRFPLIEEENEDNLNFSEFCL